MIYSFNYKAVPLTLTAFILVFVFLSCQNQNLHLSNRSDIPVFTQLHEIPGITEDEIRAVEALRENYDYFTYGMILTTEAFIHNNGNYGGFSRLFCDWLTELFGIKFELVIMDGVTHLERLHSGDIDFSGNIMPTPERLDTLIMTDTIVERQFIMIRLEGKSITDIPPGTLRRYAFFPGTPGEDAVASVTDPGSYRSVWVNNFNDAYNALVNDDADAFIVTSAAAANFMMYDNLVMENYYPLIFNPISMATAKPDLEPVISIVNRILRNGGRPYIGQLYNTGDQDYWRHRLFSMLSPEERAFIDRNPVIPIAAISDDYPLSFYNVREGRWQGIYFDLLEEVSFLTGLSFELVHDQNEDRENISELLSNGDALIYPELDNTAQRKESFIWSDRVILNDYMALVSRSDHRYISLNDVPNMRIGIARNTSYAAAFMEWFPLHPHVTEYFNIDKAFTALQNGEVDMVMTTQTRVMQLTHLQELVGFKANLIFRQPIETRFVFVKSEPLLKSIADKALGITDIERIINSWMQRTYDYRVNVLEAQRPWLISAAVLSMLVLSLVLFVLYRNKKMTARMILINKDAETANKVKNAFLANMSHELKTPLNSTINMIKEALLEKGEKSRNESLHHAYASSNDLLSVLNTILEISNIESGKLSLSSSPFVLGMVILDINSLINTLCRAKGIFWEPHINVPVILTLEGDRIRLMQALTILLRNAVKYANEEEGRVIFNVKPVMETEDTVSIHFEISDNGIGMTEKKLSELKQMFSLDNKDIHYSSDEIMLSACNFIIKAMGSNISVESISGSDMHGTVFSFELNFPKAVMPVQTEETETENFAFQGKRVLIVDDVAVNRKVLINILEETGIDILEASDGEEALKIFLSAPDSLDIILMDIMMPKMDGYEAVKNIRNSRFVKGRTIPIIAVTTRSYKEDVDMAINSGMNFHIEKPVDPKILLSSMKRFLR